MQLNKSLCNKENGLRGPCGGVGRLLRRDVAACKNPLGGMEGDLLISWPSSLDLEMRLLKPHIERR